MNLTINKSIKLPQKMRQFFLKKVNTSFLIFVFTFSNAQITITQYDLPSVNDTIYFKTGTINNFDPNITGANVTWDFSGALLNNQRTDTIIPVTSTPVVYNVIFNFTIANLAYINQTPPSLGGGLTVTDYYDFYKKASSYYRKAGFGATINGVQTPVRYDNPELFYKLPLTYGTTDSSVSSYGLSIPGYGYYGQTINRKHIADGWGTLITPFGTYEAIRVKQIIDIVDTIYSESMSFGYNVHRPVSYEYYWLTNAFKGHFVKIAKNGMINSIEIQFTPSNLIYSNNSQNVNTFPNPVNDILYLLLFSDEMKNISLVNSMGQIVLFEKCNEKVHSMDLSLLSNGIYMLKVESPNIKYSKKIIIRH